MNKKNCFKVIMALFIICLVTYAKSSISTKAAGVISGERAIGGLSYYLDKLYNNNTEVDLADLFSDSAEIPENVAFANVNDYLNIRKSNDLSAAIIGYLPKNGMCEVLEIKGEWAYIKSGNIKGYVSLQYLITGDEGKAMAESLSTLMATVKAGTVNFRSEPDTLSQDNIIATVRYGEKLPVIEECVISKDDDNVIWVKAYCDDLEGYVSKEFVDIAYDWDKAVSLQEVLNGETTIGASSLRNQIIIEAKKHIGLKYVWGGNSLKTGADCSGFCLAVYRACGIDTSSLPRTSYDLAASSKGRTIKLEDAQPGDLVFYGSKSGKVNHVAIYMGNGMIIHESGRKDGCKVSSVYYRTVLKVRSFID